MKDGSIQTVIERLTGEELVLFVGAAISNAKPSSLPGFLDLQNEMLWALHKALGSRFSQLYRDLYADIKSRQFINPASQSIVSVPPEYIMELGRQELDADGEQKEYFALEPVLGMERASPNHNHVVVAGLLASQTVKAVFTTNFDTLIEKAYALVQPLAKEQLRVFKNLDDFSDISDLPRGLYKIHGCLSEPASIVTSLNDVGYRAVRQKYKSLSLALKNHSVLFIGYRGADLDVFSYLASVRCKELFWNDLNCNYVIKKIERVLTSQNARFIEGDLCSLLPQLWSPPEGLSLESKERVCANERIDRRLSRWAQNADKNSIRLLLGGFWEYVDNTENAQRFYRSGRVSSARRGMGELRNAFMGRSAALLYKEGRLDKATKLCRACLRAAEDFSSLSRLYEYITSLQLLALIEATRDLDLARKLLSQVQEYQELLEEHVPSMGYRKAVFLQNSGNLMFRARRFEDAANLYSEALIIFDDIGDVLGRARLLNNLGSVQLELGNLSECITLFMDSSYLLEEVCDIHEIPDVYLNLARSFSQLGDLENQMKYASLAMKGYVTIDNNVGHQRAEKLLTSRQAQG